MSEDRYIRSTRLEYREADKKKPPTLTGYASVFDTPYDVHDALGAYSETVAPGAFTRSLAAQPDVRLLVNHDGLPLARTKSGTLHLSEDQRGLHVRAELDPADPDVQALLPKLRRGDLGEMSFAFRVPKGGDTWNAAFDQRTLTNVDINGGDVSLVTYPANPETSVSVRKTEMKTGAITPDDSAEDVAYKKVISMAYERGAESPGIHAFPGLQPGNIKALRAVVTELEDTISNGKASEAREAKTLISEARRILTDHEEDHRNGNNVAAMRGATPSASYENQWRSGSEEVYRPDNKTSFFSDLQAARRGDWDASERLSRNNATQSRDVSTGSGSGGAFAPPAWLIQEWVKLVRPGRVTADLVSKQILPAGASSINLPKVATGTTTAIQATENNAVSKTDLTSSAVTSSISTIAGQNVVSLQMLHETPIGFDQVILTDLAADYAKQLDAQVISGSGSGGQLRGILNVSSLPTTTYTSASPTALGTGSLYNKLISAINTINTTRYASPSAIVMHPRRWAWLLQAVDGAGRPLILSDGDAYNSPGMTNGAVAQGQAGTLANLPVYIDANVPTNLGVGTNQDAIIVAKFDDLHLWETPLLIESFEAPYAQNLSVLFRAYAHSAFIPDRHVESLNVITGTGLVAPSL